MNTKLFIIGIIASIGLVVIGSYVSRPIDETKVGIQTKAGTQQCPISGDYECFKIHRCNRASGAAGDGTGSACYRYIFYTCNEGRYSDRQRFLSPISKCWSKENAIARISEICGCTPKTETPTPTYIPTPTDIPTPTPTEASEPVLIACEKPACHTPCHTLLSEGECKSRGGSECEWLEKCSKCTNSEPIPMCDPETGEQKGSWKYRCQ